LLTSTYAPAQADQIPFQKYNVADGLPEESIQELLQDDLGFIWIVTQNGLVKYNGYDFQVFSPADSSGPQFNAYGSWQSMLKGNQGRIWLKGCDFNSNLRISYFDPTKQAFTNDAPAWGASKSLEIELKMEDQKGQLWFLRLDRSTSPPRDNICRLDPATGAIKVYPAEIVGNFALLVESAGDIWVSGSCLV
jgi:streptogramin lyase